MSIELLQWWRWNQFVSFEFWWQKSCCYCLCQSWCCCYNDTMLPNNDTKYFHSRWSLSIGLACRSALPLELGAETVTGSILQSVLGGVSQYYLVKNPQFTRVGCHVQDQKKKRSNTLQCRCFSTAISQHVLVYLCHQTLKYLELRWESSRPSLVNSPPASIEPTARARTRVQSLLKY